jgi:phenolic acid decarboxylase
MPSDSPEALKGILGKRIKYFYEVDGERWEYNAYYQNERRVVYSIRGGPMNGRHNYQAAQYMRIREGIYQVNRKRITRIYAAHC